MSVTCEERYFFTFSDNQLFYLQRIANGIPRKYNIIPNRMFSS